MLNPFLYNSARAIPLSYQPASPRPPILGASAPVGANGVADTTASVQSHSPSKIPLFPSVDESSKTYFQKTLGILNLINPQILVNWYSKLENGESQTLSNRKTEERLNCLA